MRSRLSLAVGLAAAFALNVATPANAHDSSKHSSKRSQVTTPKAGTVKQRVRRSASHVGRVDGQAPYDARDAYYGDRYYSDDPITHAHETTHGINSHLTNQHRGATGDYGFYVGGGRAVVLTGPRVTLSPH